jgi:predicted nuclease of predicted toxin-antitoxin system
MNFVADANIPRQVIERLRGEGHIVEAITEMHPEMAEREILELANQRSAIVLTADTDFGDLVFRQAYPSVSVILFVFGSFPLIRERRSF